MSAIIVAVIMVILALGASSVTYLTLMALVKRLNTRYKEAIERIDIERLGAKDGYYVYGAQSEHLAMKASILCGALGSFFILLCAVLQFYEHLTVNNTIILVGTGFFFNFFFPMGYCIYSYFKSNNLLQVTPSRIEAWRFEKERVYIRRVIEWSDIKKVGIGIPRYYYGITDMDGYILTLLLRPKGRLTMWGDWVNVKLFLKDLLRYAPQSLTNYCESLIRSMID